MLTKMDDNMVSTTTFITHAAWARGFRHLKNQGTVFSRHVYLVQCQSLESLLLIPIPWFAALIVFTFQL